VSSEVGNFYNRPGSTSSAWPLWTKLESWAMTGNERQAEIRVIRSYAIPSGQLPGESHRRGIRSEGGLGLGLENSQNPWP
jgi:hypothetical protein